MRILTDDPRELGADRIANAVAAQRLYGTPAIVIDFGTATTFDAISAEGDYLGNAIAPGLGIAADALFRQTARLPRVELVAPPSPVGTDTVSSIQSGLIYGYVGLVEGMVARLKAELGGNPRVIATGEQCAVIGRLTPVVDTIDPNLTLAGLRILYDLNR
jgi:type III pantothenate kinase